MSFQRQIEKGGDHGKDQGHQKRTEELERGGDALFQGNHAIKEVWTHGGDGNSRASHDRSQDTQNLRH